MLTADEKRAALFLRLYEFAAEEIATLLKVSFKHTLDYIDRCELEGISRYRSRIKRCLRCDERAGEDPSPLFESERKIFIRRNNGMETVTRVYRKSAGDEQGRQTRSK